MRRRQLISLLGGAAMVWPAGVRAQQPAMPVIGFLNAASPEGYAHYVAGFRQGLADSGYIENQNVAIEYRWAEGQYERLPALATDLVRRRVDVIAAGGAVAAQGSKTASRPLPPVPTRRPAPMATPRAAPVRGPRTNLSC